MWRISTVERNAGRSGLCTGSLTESFYSGRVRPMRWSVGSCCLCWSLVCAPLIGQVEAGTAGLPTAKPAPLVRGALMAEQAPKLSRRAEQHRSRGEYARAELLWQRVLTIQEQALGSEHP